MQRGFRILVGAFLSTLFLVGCSDCEGTERFENVISSLSATPQSIDFGRVYVGDSQSVDILLRNTASADAQALAFELEGDAAADFGAVLPGANSVAGGATLSLTLQLSPLSAGRKTASLLVTADDFRPLTISLTGRADEPRVCDDDNACTEDTFDFESGRCRSTPVEVTRSCDDDNACTAESYCSGGECRGVAVVCPPASTACATALCTAEDGCVEIPDDTQCDDGDPCTEDRCVLGVGCRSTVALNGTPCGPVGQCDVSMLCADGVCQPFEVPDGAFCVDNDACTTNPRCEAGACVADPAPLAMEFMSRSLTIGDDGAFVVIADNGDFIFADPHFTGGPSLAVVRPAAPPFAQVRSVLDLTGTTDMLVTAGSHVVQVGGSGVVFDFTSWTLSDSGQLSLQGSRSFSLGGSLSNHENLRGFSAAADGDDFVICAHDRAGWVHFRIREDGPVVMAENVMQVGTTCADIAFRDGRVVVAEQNLRTDGSADIEPGVFATWRWEEDRWELERLLRINEECDSFATQPLLAEISADGANLLLGCGTGAVNPQTRLRADQLFVVDADLPSPTLSNALEIPLNDQRRVVDVVVDGDAIRVWADDSYDTFVCTLSSTTLELTQCGPPFKMDAIGRTAGWVAANAGQTASSVTGGILSGALTQIPRMGELGAVVAHEGNFFSVSRTAVHRFSLVGTEVLWTGSTSLFDVDELGVFAFGGGGAGPYLIQPGANAGAVYAAHNPLAPFLIGRFDAAKAPLVAQGKAGGTVASIAADVLGAPTNGPERVAQLIMPTADVVLQDLWSEEVEGEALGDRATQLHAFGDTITATYNSGPNRHHLAIIDVQPDADGQVVPVLIAALPQESNLPLATAAIGSEVVRLRGRNIGNGFEAPGGGSVEWWRLSEGSLTLVGDVLVGGVVDILWLAESLALVSTEDGFAFVERNANDEISLRQSYNLGGPALGVSVVDGVAVITTSRSVSLFSPPCASSP